MDWPSPAGLGLASQHTGVMQYRNRLCQCGFSVLAPACSPRLRADSILSSDTFAQSVWSRKSQ